MNIAGFVVVVVVVVAARNKKKKLTDRQIFSFKRICVTYWLIVGYVDDISG